MEMKHGGNVWMGTGPEQWLDFSANLRPEGPPPWVRETLREALSRARYYPDPDMAGARAGLAEYAGLAPDCILPMPGGTAAIELALSLRRGRVLLERPTFGEYSARARALGRACPDRIDECHPGDTRLIGNPNNPDGRTRSRAEVLELHEKVRDCGGELVVDEAFIDYCPESSVRDRVCPDLTVVGSLTKALCIPGIRLGYICASPQNIAELEKRVRPWQVNALALAVAENLPGHLEELRRDAAENEKRRLWLSRAHEKDGVRTLPSLANFLLCDFGHSMAGAVQALREQGILVRTCESFGLGASWLRLAVRTREENEHLMEALEACPK